MNRLSYLLAVIALLAAAGLSGCGGSAQKGEAEIWITRDRGETVLEQGTVPAGLTALQGLDRLADVETRYSGAFVTAIDGVSSSRLHQRDWFYFVNGYESDRGAASYRLRAGDVEWWDYHSWRSQERAPVVVGAFPEPFIHGFGGKRRPAAVRFQPGFRSEALALARVIHARSIAATGKPVAAAANLLLVVAGRSGLVASLRNGERAGDPVRFIVSGKSFARALARDPSVVRFRYQVRP